MRKVKIVTDSTCDLPFDMLAQREITLVPMHVILGEQSYLDDGTLDSRELFRFADSTGVLPKSAAINAFEFETIFRRLSGHQQPSVQHNAERGNCGEQHRGR
jgi:fatty acid-binding protein DegV